MSDAAAGPCDACASAEANALTGYFRRDCFECRARSVAQSPAAGNAPVEVKKAALVKAFGDEWRKWLPRVQHWEKRIKEAKSDLRTLR